MSKYVDKCLVLDFLAQVLTTMKGKKTNEKKQKSSLQYFRYQYTFKRIRN